MATTVYGDIGTRTAAWAAKTMLEHAQPILVLSRYAQSKPLPMNSTKIAKFRRPVPFPSVHGTQLVEGVTPTARRMQYEDVEVTMGQYGDLVEITDHVNDMSEDPVLRDASELAGEQAAETMEMILYGVMKAGTNVFYGASSDTARTDVNDKITRDRQRAVTRSLKAQRAKKITSQIDASPKYGTSPVAGAFIAFHHTDMESDIRDMTSFVPVEEYAASGSMEHETGKCEDVRYIGSPLLSPWLAAGSGTLNGMKSVGAANVDVYPALICGKASFGNVPLKGPGAIAPRVINPGTIDKSDPLGQRGYVGWKAYMVSVILNQLWMARLEVGVTA